jgi:hypothetical protein
VLSPAAAVVHPAPAVPTLDPRLYRSVMRQIDQAFSDYQSQPAWDSVWNAANTFVDALVLGDNSPDPTAATGLAQDEYAQLAGQLTAAVSRLPYGRGIIVPLLESGPDGSTLTPGNAKPFRDWIKAQVRRQIVTDLRTHVITLAYGRW